MTDVSYYDLLDVSSCVKLNLLEIKWKVLHVFETNVNKYKILFKSCAEKVSEM